MGKFGETDDGKWIIKTEICVDFFVMQKTNYGMQNIDFRFFVFRKRRKIHALNLWILRFAQYDKDFVSMTKILRYFTLLRKVQYDKNFKFKALNFKHFKFKARIQALL